MKKEQLIDHNGNPIVLGSELGKGGEGAVFNIEGSPDTVAKIYFKLCDRAKADKITGMIGSSNGNLLKLAAWPLKSIHKRSGELVGFVMQKLQGYHPIFKLYGPKLRLQEFPQADWRFLIHAATNTARAFSVVHEAGHVIGDVNHGNLLVSKDATVKLIDTDSFQISVNGKNWLCEVGVATHQPPEMQGRSTYKDIIRTPKQDNFGLAVLIFQLLCLARHPFSGRFSGHGDMPIEKAIAECRFAFSRDSRLTQMTPPPASLPMTALSPKIWMFFERAFGRDGLRPTAKEWVAALEELPTLLTTCRSNQGHHYIKSLTACPWCDIEVRSNTTIFPVIVRSVQGNQNFHVLWQQVMGIKDPGPASELPDIATISFASTIVPSREAKEVGTKIRDIKRRSCFLITGLAIPLIGVSVFYDSPLCLFASVGIVIVGISYASGNKRKLTKGIEKTLHESKKQWKELSANWKTWASSSPFTDIRHKLDVLKQKHDCLKQERQLLLRKLWDDRRKQQLIAYLDQCYIAGAQIDGIGPGRTATLQSYGIETAVDVIVQRMSGISGFGPKLIQRLTNWRDHCERSFVFNPVKEISQLAIQAVDNEIMLKRNKLERELAIGIKNLSKIGEQILERRKLLHTRAEAILKVYAQSVIDAREVGINP